MTLLIFYLLLALVVSFLCSILEAVLLSVSPSYIQGKLNENKAWAHRLFQFKKDIDRPLAAILSLNTISHTVGAAGVGAQAGIVFSNVSVGVISGVLTLLILVVSELIPKTIGANYWKSLAPFTTQTLVILNVAMYPLVILSQAVTRLFKKPTAPSVERSEIVALAEIGYKEGVFKKEEALILKNLMSLRTLSVQDVMTPRTVMVAARESLTAQAFFNNEAFNRFTRIPLFGVNKDDITGFVHKHDVLSTMGQQQNDTLLKDLKRDLPMLPNNQSLFEAYSFLTQNNVHMALVVEEFGGTAGLITMEDVLETLLGMEIVDEFDTDEDLRAYARERWKKRAARLGLAISNNPKDDIEA
jgi:CBS domain containing-hemolysin-like protein